MSRHSEFTDFEEDAVTTGPIVEALGECPDACGPLVRVLDTDASHVGYALALLRAVTDGDAEFAATIKQTLDREELLRGCLEFARSLAFSMATAESNIPGLPHTPEQGLAADCAAAYTYLSGAADTIRLAVGSSPSNGGVVAQVARVFDDLAWHMYAEDSAQITVHATTVTAAAGACKILSDSCARRFGITFDDQADLFVRAFAAGT